MEKYETRRPFTSKYSKNIIRETPDHVNLNYKPNPQTNVRKCLTSTFHIEQKPFHSILLCKQKHYHKKNDPNTQFIGPFGPLIVTHAEKKDKIPNPPKKFRFDDNLIPIKKYNYFKEHKKCNETEYCWKDQQKPKILRHYSNDKNKNKYKNLDATTYWMIN